MLNNFILAEESSEVFVSYGKVITNKDGIIEIVGLKDVVIRKVVNTSNDCVCLITGVETFDVYKNQSLLKNIINTTCESLNTELKAGYTV